MKTHELTFEGAIAGLLSIIFLAAAFSPLAFGDEAVLAERQRLLEAARRDGAEAVPLLSEALDDERTIINRTAAHLLARLGESGLPGIEKALSHSDAQLRLIAVDSLADMDRLNDYWATILMDHDPVVRRKVKLDLLKRHPLPEGDAFDGILDELMASYAQAAPDARMHLVDMFASFDTLTPQARQALIAAARDEDNAIREAAYQGIMKHIERDWAEASELLAASQEDDSETIRKIGLEMRWKLLEVRQIRLPQDGWRFKTDPDAVGRGQRWFDPEFDDAGWRRDVPIESSWKNHMAEDYNGAAWYRLALDVPRLREWDRAYLHFEGVDEEAWVWLNGQFVGSHEMGPGGWDTPFVLDATDALKPGGTNLIAVMAKNTGGGAGIWQPVRLRVLNSALVGE